MKTETWKITGQETARADITIRAVCDEPGKRFELWIADVAKHHAPLVVSAPDLLEACKFILSMLDPDGDHPKHQHKIYSDTLSPEDDDRTVTLYLRDIIKKAEGAL